jgi:hypothetical protein
MFLAFSARLAAPTRAGLKAERGAGSAAAVPRGGAALIKYGSMQWIHRHARLADCRTRSNRDTLSRDRGEC